MSKITANYSLQRPTEETEVAAAAVFLASFAFSNVSADDAKDLRLSFC